MKSIKYLLALICLVLFCSSAWGYDIGITGVTVVQRGNDVFAIVTVELGISGTTYYTKDVTAHIDMREANWKTVLKEKLKLRALLVNEAQMLVDNFNSGVSDFKAWMKGQVSK